jgi:hypothetical protein
VEHLSVTLGIFYQTRLEKLARVKQSCLLRRFVNDGLKKFRNIGPCILHVYESVNLQLTCKNEDVKMRHKYLQP